MMTGKEISWEEGVDRSRKREMDKGMGLVQVG
jgi:hypothetical protein